MTATQYNLQDGLHSPCQKLLQTAVRTAQQPAASPELPEPLQGWRAKITPSDVGWGPHSSVDQVSLRRFIVIGLVFQCLGSGIAKG